MRPKIYRDGVAAAEQKEIDRAEIYRRLLIRVFNFKCDDRIDKDLFDRNDRGEITKKGYPQNY